MGHRQWKIRWCCEMELLSFNPSNVPGDTHQITTEPSVHSHTDRGERTQPDPHCPHCCSPSSSPPLPLSPLLCSMLRGGVKEEGRQWRCGWEHTQCPVPHCFQMKWHSLCLSCTGTASLMSPPLPQTASDLSIPSTLYSHAESTHTVQRRGYQSVWDSWTFFKAALDSSTADELGYREVQAPHSSASPSLSRSLPSHYQCTDVCPAMRGSELSD